MASGMCILAALEQPCRLKMWKMSRKNKTCIVIQVVFSQAVCASCLGIKFAAERMDVTALLAFPAEHIDY